LVAKLKEEGLVDVVGAAQDRRAVAIRLTTSGRRRTRGVLEQRGRCLTEMVGALSAAEQQQFEKLVAKLLPQLVVEPAHGVYICRLCDHDACPPSRCPVNDTCKRLTEGVSAAGRTAT
jgi:hypothetical protein